MRSMKNMEGWGLRPQSCDAPSHCTVTRVQGVYSDSITAILSKKGYKLGKTIGEGSYSKVRIAYKASELGYSHRLGCKIVNKKKASRDFVTKFLPREVSIVRVIRHPHIVTVFNIIELDDQVYMFMDLCERGDLLDHIRTKGAFTETKAKHFFSFCSERRLVIRVDGTMKGMTYCACAWSSLLLELGRFTDRVERVVNEKEPEKSSLLLYDGHFGLPRQLVDAVGYLHAREIAHRDLKCENVLMSNRDNVKIADFGFARWCCDLQTRKRVLSDTFCGSAAYAAPEILQGTKYNPKMYDVWSLGCILYIMLCATMPFDDANIKQMLKIQTLRKLTFPPKCSLTTRVKRLVMHILEPDVTRRATVNQILSCPWLMNTDCIK